MHRPLILGFGISGKAAAHYFEKQSVDYLVYDDKLSELEKKFSHGQLVHGDLIEKMAISKVVISPGIDPRHPVYQWAQSKNIPITSELDIALSLTERPVIGITGTNGKTTVTKFISEALSSIGWRAIACGNYGLPLIEALSGETEHTVYCVEVSSYQLELIHQKKFDYGLILNVTQDHLDRYPSMSAYAAAKWRLSHLLKPHGKIWVQRSILATYGFIGDERVIPIEGEDQQWDFLSGYSGRERENYAMAWQVLHAFKMTRCQMVEHLGSFQKPHHRIEFIGAVDGVGFHDDSKGTNVDAVLFALERFMQPVILLAGGKDKNSDYTPWIAPFKKQVKAIVLFGEAKHKISSVLAPYVPTYLVEDLMKAVDTAFSMAKSGDQVLLSPGCSSYDQFKDYQHRAEVFKGAVQALSEGNKNE
jgi:UDP-N-acetylmuramoylalanine--D-glutamate ligase